MKTLFLPTQPFYRIGEAEGVYAARAAKGWILKKSGRYFDRYEKAEPQTLQYRLEFFKREGPDAEQLELYEGAGWKLVSHCAYNGRAVFVSASPLAEELYSDPDASLNMLRRLRWARLTDGIMVALFVALEACQLSGFGRRGLWQMLAVSDSLLVIGVLIAALLVFKGCYGIVRLSILIRRIKRGRQIDHNARLSIVERFQRALTLGLTAALILSFGTLFVEAYQVSKEHPLPEPAAAQPWFEAAELFSGSHRMTADESAYFYIKGAQNTIQYGGTWLYPESYEIESYAACGPAIEGYLADIRMLDVDCIRARNEKLAEKLAWDIAAHSIWLSDDEEPMLQEDERFDLVLGVQFERVFVRGTCVYAVTCIEQSETTDYWNILYDLIDKKMDVWEG